MIYLDNAATSWPKPPEVLRAVNGVMSRPFVAGIARPCAPGGWYTPAARRRPGILAAPLNA